MMPHHTHRLSPDEIDELRRLIGAGLQDFEIADQTGQDKAIVAYWRRRFAQPPKPVPRTLQEAIEISRGGRMPDDFQPMALAELVVACPRRADRIERAARPAEDQPGIPGKIAQLCERLALGLELWQPGDVEPDSN